MKDLVRWIVVLLVVAGALFLVGCTGKPVLSSSTQNGKTVVAADGIAEKNTQYSVEIKIKDVVFNDTFTTDNQGNYHLSYTEKIGSTVLTKDMKIDFVVLKDGKKVFSDIFEIH